MSESCYTLLGTLPHVYRGFTMQGASTLVAFQRDAASGGHEIDVYDFPSLAFVGVRGSTYVGAGQGQACGDPTTGRLWHTVGAPGFTTITRLDPDGTATLLSSAFTGNIAGLTYCPVDDCVYAAVDAATSIVVRCTQGGALTTVWTAPHTSEAFVFANAVTTPDGAMWFRVGDSSSSARRGILRVTTSGTAFLFTTVIGSSGYAPRADSSIRLAQGFFVGGVGHVEQSVDPAFGVTYDDCLEPGTALVACSNQQLAGRGYLLAASSGSPVHESGDTIWTSESPPPPAMTNWSITAPGWYPNPVPVL